MKRVNLLFLLFISLSSFAQKFPEIEALNRVILNHKDSIIYAQLLPEGESKKVSASDKYWYNWYAQHDIKETKGGFSGKLLHGAYTEYYENKDLKRKGNFKKGLKSGKWKSWYKSGQLSEVVYFKNGLQQGKFITYKETGEIKEVGKYKEGVKVEQKEKKAKAGKEKKSKKEPTENNIVTPEEENKEELKKEKKKKKKNRLILRFEEELRWFLKKVKKAFNMLRAGALFVAVAISFVIAVLISMLITLAFHYKIQTKDNLVQKKLERNCTSALTLLMYDEEYQEGNNIIDLYGMESDSVQLTKRFWGVYEVAAVKAFSGRYQLSKTLQYGRKPDEINSGAIYLADLNRPLNVCGKTKITGLCFLPEAGVKRGYIEGKGFEGSTMVNGTIKNSKNALPELNKEMIKKLSASYKLETHKVGLFKEINLSEIDSLIQSFSDSTAIIQFDGKLSSKYLSGNIILFSDTVVTIDKSMHLEDVLIVAQAIIFKKGFIGNLQAFAKDSIIVEEDCKLNYPSALGLFKTDYKTQQPFIRLMKNSELKGLIFTTQSEFISDLAMTKVTIEKEAKVEGQIYVDGFADIQGELWGSVWCQKFLLKTASSVYENHLLNAVINRTKLSEHYVGSSLIGSGKKKKIMKWLE